MNPAEDPGNLPHKNLLPEYLPPENLLPENLLPEYLLPEYLPPENLPPENLPPGLYYYIDGFVSDQWLWMIFHSLFSSSLYTSVQFSFQSVSPELVCRL